MPIEHDTLTNDTANPTLKLLHIPGYSVINASAMVAITTGSAGDICYVQDSGAYYTYNGTAWLADVTPFAAKTGSYTLTAQDSIVTVNGTYTITLPTAVGCTGRRYTITNVGTGVVTVNTTSSQTIDGELTQALNQYDSMDVVSTGSAWLIT